MKRIACHAGIRCAEGRIARTPDDVISLFERHGRIAVKSRAVDTAGRTAVLACEAEVEAFLRTGFRPRAQLCEAYADGTVCRVDAVVSGERVVWDVSQYGRDVLARRRGLPLSSWTVADPALRSAARLLLCQVIDAWRVDRGVLHLKAFAAGSGLTFGEVSGRPAGAGVSAAFRATTGIDLGRARILAGTGGDPRAARRDPAAAHAGWTAHYSAGGGTLLEFDDSAVAPHAYHRALALRVGDSVPVSAVSGTGVSTHVFAHDSQDEVRRLVSRAETAVRVVTAERAPGAGRP